MHYLGLWHVHQAGCDKCRSFLSRTSFVDTGSAVSQNRPLHDFLCAIERTTAGSGRRRNGQDRDRNSCCDWLHEASSYKGFAIVHPPLTTSSGVGRSRQLAHRQYSIKATSLLPPENMSIQLQRPQLFFSCEDLRTHLPHLRHNAWSYRTSRPYRRSRSRSRGYRP